MRFTALAVTGELVRTDGALVKFPNGHVFRVDTPTANPYTPVYAVDPATGTGLLLCRGHQDDGVYVRADDGWSQKLADRCEGKWPLGILVVGPGQFLCAWIAPPQIAQMDRAVVNTSTRTVTPLPRIPIRQSLCLLDLDGFDRFRLESDTEPRPNGTIDVTRNGRTVPLGYPHLVNGRVVGSDMRPNAPNQLILADTDDFYVVVESTPSVQFPARLDLYGNVACFEGQYFANADIRTRLLPPDVPVVTPPRTPEPTPDPPAVVEPPVVVSPPPTPPPIVSPEPPKPNRKKLPWWAKLIEAILKAAVRKGQE